MMTAIDVMFWGTIGMFLVYVIICNLLTPKL